MKKIYSFLLLMILASGVSYSQVAILSENMGTAPATTAIASHTFQNGTPITFTGTADVRNSTASTGYTGASGLGNVFFTAAGRNLIISGINTAGYSSLSLSFGLYKSTTASNATEFTVEVSTDGISYNPLTFPAQPTGAGTANWRLITITGGTIPATTNLRIRFTNNTAATTQFRLDDVVLTGTASGATITTDLSVSGGPFTFTNCVDTTTGSIAYTKTGTFNPGNIFTAQLSDASGSFASPLNIGTLTSVNDGSISISIPSPTITGTGYKIRVIGSDPAVTGSESNAFTITQNGVCISSSTDFFRSAQDGFWNQASTWESSPDQVTWIPSTLIPNSTSAGVLITEDHIVTLNSAVTIDQTVVDSSAQLVLQTSTGNNLTVANGSGDDLTVFGTLVYQGSILPVITGTIRIKTDGTFRINSGTGGPSGALAGNTSTNVFYEHNSVFNWNVVSAIATSNQTYFPNAGVNEVPIFRVTVNQGSWGATNPTTINGLFEMGSGNSVEWQSSATKTFRNGIKLNAGATMNQLTSSGAFIINGTDAELSGPGTLNLTNGGLNCTGGTLNNLGNLTANTTNANINITAGTWAGNGHTLNGTARFIYGNNISLTGTTHFERFGTNGNATINSVNGYVDVAHSALIGGGVLNVTSNFKLLSSPSGTAYLDDFTAGTGSVNGVYQVERYIPGAANGFRQLGTPVTLAGNMGSSLNGFSVAGNAAAPGFLIPFQTGCHPDYVAFNSPYSNWQELIENATPQLNCVQSLLFAKTSGLMENGKGYYLDVPGQSTLTFTGTNTTGPVSQNLTRQNPTLSNGYNIVSNPYPSPLTWTPDANIDGIAKVYSASGLYTGSWVDVDPGDVIAIGQGFQVRVSTGTSATFAVDNTDRTTGTPTYLFSGNAAQALNIDILSDNKADYCRIRFHEEATTNFDNLYDAPKLMGDNNKPMLYSIWNGELYSTNTFGNLENVVTIPLGLKLTASGSHTFTFSNLDQFAASSFIYLEDVQTGVWQNMRVNDSYTFTSAAGNHTDRFNVHFYPPVEYQITQEATCENGANVSLTENAPISWNYILNNENGTEVDNGTLDGNAQILNIPAGEYTLVLTEPVSGYVAEENLTVTGAFVVTAEIVSSLTQAETGQEITFTAQTIHADQFSWNFGDGNTSEDMNPVHFYNAEGTYVVMLSASNDDCEASAQTSIQVTAGTVSIQDEMTENGIQLWTAANTIHIILPSAGFDQSVFTLYDMQGKRILNRNLQGTVQSFDLSGIASGRYIAEIAGNTQTVTRKIIIGIN